MSKNSKIPRQPADQKTKSNVNLAQDQTGAILDKAMPAKPTFPPNMVMKAFSARRRD
ncbi:MAG: hypothetical protein LV479_12455 [Methylacidiphilales bacterium]|nr:hypothetical protein [Candidatus Methylacidiphilales bacterium]